MALYAQQPSADALIEAGHWKRARSLVEQRLRESPDDPNALFLSSQIQNGSALDETLSAAAQAVADHPLPYFRAAAQLLAGGREPERAQRYLRIYLMQEPEGNEPPAAEARAKLEIATRLRGPAHQRGLP